MNAAQEGTIRNNLHDIGDRGVSVIGGRDVVHSQKNAGHHLRKQNKEQARTKHVRPPRTSRNSCIIRFQPVRSSSQPEILRGSLLLSISMGDFAVMGESDIKKDSSPELPTPPVAYQGRGSRLQDIIQ